MVAVDYVRLLLLKNFKKDFSNPYVYILIQNVVFVCFESFGFVKTFSFELFIKVISYDMIYTIKPYDNKYFTP